MIINTSPDNEAILSNVDNVGEFRIKNSSKAFHILSSGLYENKIRAIIRELSCNAYDSHVAAGKKDTPFDVHLPNTFEPWFSIRDYGTGLTNDQVINIYTTYFESTKTNSNDFVGALGLGSKSPFSYTDNFTVIAIRDGIKGIYTAFINEHGVPSIALMHSEETDEPAGVEVKFSVDNRSDFNKFSSEAGYVYSYFTLMPAVTGNSYFSVNERKYSDKDIIPGVHRMTQSGGSVAVMGNIPYPIRVPNAEQNLGSLNGLLQCSLEIHFEIGELDFQASREGLSYIPQTIEAIKNKLETLSEVLAVKLTAEVDAIQNKWEQALFLEHKRTQNIWAAPTRNYLNTHKLELFKDMHLTTIQFPIEELASKFNIKINKFVYSPGYKQKITNIKPLSVWDSTINGYVLNHDVRIRANTHFVINDTKIGASNRAKHHWKSLQSIASGDHTVYVLEPADKNKPLLTDNFFAAIYNPPSIYNASDLITQPKKKTAVRESDVTIMRLVESASRRTSYKWVNAGKLEDFDPLDTVYYLPLSGYTPISEHGSLDAANLFSAMYSSGIRELREIHAIYGVRKSDIAMIEKQSNWINVESYIIKVLQSLNGKQITQLMYDTVDKIDKVMYTADSILRHVDDKTCVYAKAVKPYIGLIRSQTDTFQFKSLIKRYKINFDIDAARMQVDAELDKVFKTYPLLNSINQYASNAYNIAHYINLINFNTQEKK